MENQDFQYKSYQLHQQSYSGVNRTDVELYENWFEKSSVDVWRHLRMLNAIDPFLTRHPKAQWLTVGDGRYGTSARYINQKGSDALATDIDTSLLEIAKQKKWISSYIYANAEALPFEDNSFDYAFCKEAYHHFPRAFIGIYEMLRVAKKAVILTEPCDWLPSSLPRRLLQMAKHGLKRIMNVPVPHSDTGNYEPDGNYIFTINPREVEKIAMGLHLPFIAYKKFHDIYIKGVEQEPIAANGPLFKKIKKQMSVQKIKTRLGLSSYNRIAAVFFKELPGEELLNDFRQLGFTVVKLPSNPFLSA